MRRCCAACYRNSTRYHWLAVAPPPTDKNIERAAYAPPSASLRYLCHFSFLLTDVRRLFYFLHDICVSLTFCLGSLACKWLWFPLCKCNIWVSLTFVSVHSSEQPLLWWLWRWRVSPFLVFSARATLSVCSLVLQLCSIFLVSWECLEGMEKNN